MVEIKSEENNTVQLPNNIRQVGTPGEKIKIYIEELGPIRDSVIELKPFMIFSGESGMGKSYTVLLVHYIYRILCNAALSSFFEEIKDDFIDFLAF